MWRATGRLDVDVDQKVAGINGLGRRGIVGLGGLKYRGGWASIKMRLSLFGLCSRRRGSQGGSGRRRSAFCLWFLWFVRLVLNLFQSKHAHKVLMMRQTAVTRARSWTRGALSLLTSRHMVLESHQNIHTCHFVNVIGLKCQE